jgi:hypothetical protein
MYECLEVIPSGYYAWRNRMPSVRSIDEGSFKERIGELHKAAAGTIAYFLRDVVHGFTNAGTEPAKYRIVVTPGTNFEEFFGELSSLPTDLPPDMAKVMEIFDRFGLPIKLPDNA